MIYMKCADCAQYRLRGPCSTCVMNKIWRMCCMARHLSDQADPFAGPSPMSSRNTMKAWWSEVQEAIRHIGLHGV